jgi:uncharacterized protein
MTITGVATSIAAFVGWAAKGPTTEAVLVESFFDYQDQFDDLDERSYLGYAVNQFFENGGQQAYIVRLAGHDGTVLRPKDGVQGNGDFEIALKAGLGLLDGVAFNLLCVPGESNQMAAADLRSYCRSRRAFYIADGPRTSTAASLMSGPVATGDDLDYAALYVPWVITPNPLPPSGAVAGIIASTDLNQGVWKAPAGIEAGLAGVTGLQYALTDAENDALNALGINCLRQFSDYGNVVWGARTMQGSDQAGSQWKYIPVRRLALYIESSLDQGTQWVVFEPNNETLWSQIRLDVAEFLQGLFVQGALQGTESQQAYFVKCDAENNPQSSIDQGIVNIVVGFAPLYPSEFVVIQIQQMSSAT